MIKPLAFATLVLGAAPLAAFADPMSVGGDGNLLAATNGAANAASGSGSAIVDPADAGDSGDDDAVRDPLTTPEPVPARNARQQPNTAHVSAHAAAHAGNPPHKKAETTRWQSLLPGVMK